MALGVGMVGVSCPAFQLQVQGTMGKEEVYMCEKAAGPVGNVTVPTLLQLPLCL